METKGQRWKYRGAPGENVFLFCGNQTGSGWILPNWSIFCATRVILAYLSFFCIAYFVASPNDCWNSLRSLTPADFWSWHATPLVFPGCLLFMPHWWHTFFIGLFPMFFNSRDSQFIIWCPAWAPDLRVIDMPVRRLLLMSLRPLLCCSILDQRKFWPSSEKQLTVGIYAHNHSFCDDKVNYSFLKRFGKWLTCMEYVEWE